LAEEFFDRDMNQYPLKKAASAAFFVPDNEAQTGKKVLMLQ